MSAEETTADEAETAITRALIERRAFELSLTDDTRGAHDNWLRAERELRAERAGHDLRRNP